MIKNRKLLYFVSEDWYFCSHRLPLAVAAAAAGFEVIVVTRESRHGDVIRNAGFRLIPLALQRRSLNPLQQLRVILALIRIYRRECPSVVHHVALKPVLLGTVAARLAGVSGILNAVAGLGSLFAAPRGAAKIFSRVVSRVMAPLLNQGIVIVQNPDDLNFLAAIGVKSDRIHLIRGAGVDIQQFRPVAEPKGQPVVMMASRLLWDKGVSEFVEAAGVLRRAGVPVRFVLVGEPDVGNPSSVPEETLRSWVHDGSIEWWGRQDDMPQILAQCNVFCLPSFYGEGIPKVLLEAAASARPIITTDMPGCREVVGDGDNGLLVPPRDVAALARAIQVLLAQPDVRKRMGARARERAVNEFSEALVVEQTLDIYKRLSR